MWLWMGGSSQAPAVSCMHLLRALLRPHAVYAGLQVRVCEVALARRAVTYLLGTATSWLRTAADAYFGCAVQTWRQVLTPVQAGTFMVQAFPYGPDMLALANVVAAEARAPTVAQVFADVLGGSAEGSTPSSGASAVAAPRSGS